jgi:hypothetical protein
MVRKREDEGSDRTLASRRYDYDKGGILGRELKGKLDFSYLKIYQNT